MSHLDEQSLRRPNVFAQEASVVLCDGQVWWLPKPRVVIKPVRGASGFTTRTSSTWGDDYYERVHRLMELSQSEDFEAVISAQMDLCCELLLRNYVLNDEQLAELIQFDVSAEPAPANIEMRKTLLWTAQGISPKVSAPGSAQA